jgi:peptidoglycan/LPS O-acetylase OafA/YrhL
MPPKTVSEKKVTKKNDFRVDIQALRGVSVLAVLLFHAFPKIFPLGYLGVDFFFVISGFVVTPLILRIFEGTPTPRKILGNILSFYEKRFFRLAPALTVILLISSILIFLFYSIDDHPRFARQGIATIFIIGNLGAFRYSGDYFSINPNPLVHTWSLSVEEQIYILLPLLFLIFINRRRNIKFQVILLLIVLFSLSLVTFLFPSVTNGLYSQLGSNYQNAQFAFYSPIERFWQFGLGGLGYFTYLSIKRRDKPSKLISYVLVGGLFLTLLSRIEYSHLPASLAASLVCFVFLVFEILKNTNQKALNLLAWLGDRSYSVYLIHMPLIYLSIYSPVFKNFKSQTLSLLPAIAMLISIVLGSLFYSLIEQKFRYLRFSALKNRTAAFVGAALMTIVLPLGVFGSMDIGSKSKYWGIDRSLRQPDNPAFADPNCLRETVDGDPCIYESEDSRGLTLLVGDSHAGHLSQAFVDASDEMQFTSVVWTHPNCQFAFSRKPKSAISDSCINANLKTLKWIKSKRPDSIVISQFTQNNSELDYLKQALTEVKRLVPRVLLISNSPMFPDVEMFMVARPLILKPYDPPRSFIKEEMVKTHIRASDKLSVFARDSEIQVLDLTPMFCGQISCIRFENGQWLYRDDDHFSIFGAAKAIPPLKKFLGGS